LVRGKGGRFYGATIAAGSANEGTLYELKPPTAKTTLWTLAPIYSFGSQPGDGYVAYGGLTFSSDGVLYGATQEGGGCAAAKAGCGTVFRVTPPASPGGAWTEKVIYTFMGLSDGGFPEAGLAIGDNGHIYGTFTTDGGTNGGIFELTPPKSAGVAWTEHVLHRFGANAAAGLYPSGRLVKLENGHIYGVTAAGGTSTACANGCGTVFELNP